MAALCELREKGLTFVAGIRSKQSNLKGLCKIVGGNSLSIIVSNIQYAIHIVRYVSYCV